MTEQLDTPSVAETAARWIARLDRGDLSADELIELRNWATASPAHLHELERMADVWEGLDALGALRNLVRRPRGYSRFMRPLAIAAGLGLLALVGWLIGYRLLVSLPVELNAEFATHVGEQRTIEPGEGSLIELNTDSRMLVEFSASERLVHLDRGEAFFDVAKEDGRRFVVQTPFGDVVVTGTMFLVRVEPTGLEVTVKEGHVELHPLRKEADVLLPAVTQLEAGEVGVVDTAGDRHVENIESGKMVRKLGWRDRMLMFNGEPLDEVVKEVGRYTDIRIVIDDQVLREKRIGGYFRVGEVDDLLGTLQTDFDVDVERVSETEVRLTARYN